MAKSILVVGGAGYIGSHTCKALAEAGYFPVTYDNLSNGHRDAVRWGPLVEGDIRDKVLLVETMRNHDVAGVIHFAANIEVGESMVNPLKYFATNVGGTVTLLQAMADCGVRQLVFSSTCAIYGTPQFLPLTEAHPQQPVSPYGASKQMVESILTWAETLQGLKFAALRYFNAAGADPAGELGERHSPETHLIPLILQAASGQRAKVSIYGTDWPTPDGTCVRDYVHVADLATAHVIAIGQLLDGAESMRLNLGTGTGHSVRDVIDAVERVTGKPVPREETARRPGDPPVLVADPARALACLNWRPVLSDMDTIIATAWRFARETPGKLLP